MPAPSAIELRVRLALSFSFVVEGGHLFDRPVRRRFVSSVLSLIVSIMLAGKFVPDFVHKKAIVPGGLMALLSVASIVLTILAMIPR